MNMYDVIIYNDDPQPEISKITFRIQARSKEDARAKGDKVAAFCLPLAKTAVHVEFRSIVEPVIPTVAVPVQQYYLSCYYSTGLDHQIAAKTARCLSTPTVIRPESMHKDRWSIIQLSKTPLQPGQHPFQLTDEERQHIK